MFVLTLGLHQPYAEIFVEMPRYVRASAAFINVTVLSNVYSSAAMIVNEIARRDRPFLSGNRPFLIPLGAKPLSQVQCLIAAAQRRRGREWNCSRKDRCVRFVWLHLQPIWTAGRTEWFTCAPRNHSGLILNE